MKTKTLRLALKKCTITNLNGIEKNSLRAGGDTDANSCGGTCGASVCAFCGESKSACCPELTLQFQTTWNIRPIDTRRTFNFTQMTMILTKQTNGSMICH